MLLARLAWHRELHWHRSTGTTQGSQCYTILRCRWAAGTQAYVRRLEARLLSVKHAAELQQRCSQYKSQVGCLCRL